VIVARGHPGEDEAASLGRERRIGVEDERVDPMRQLPEAAGRRGPEDAVVSSRVVILLYEPDAATTAYSAPRWRRLDASWSGLFDPS
jgi:hypothetical protein